MTCSWSWPPFVTRFPTGSGYLCAGEAAVFQFVQWPRIATFDNSATPTKNGRAERQVKTASVDLDALKTLIGSAVDEAAANDPVALKAQLAKLQRELIAAQKHPAAAPARSGPTEAELEKARQLGFREGAASRDIDVETAWNASADAMLARLQEAATAARAKLAPPAQAKRAIAAPRNVTPGAGQKTPAPVQRPAPVARPAPISRPANNAPPAGIGSGHMRILEAVAFWESLEVMAPTRDQVAGAAGFAPGGTFRAYVGKLVGEGLLESAGVGVLALTDAGRDAAPNIDTTTSARDRIGKIIGAGHARILDAIPQDGTPITRADLAAASGFDQGGTFRAYVGKLVGLGMVEAAGVGAVKVAPWVWAGPD